MSSTFIFIFLAAVAFGVPIVFALVFAPLAGFVLAEQFVFLKVLPQRMFAGINQFPLLAIPLFMLAGQIMNVGDITSRLVRFANAIVGHLRGGLAHVNILSSIMFAGLSGSAVADTSALGSILIPAMEKDGYTRRFAAAVTAASSIIGPIIPPSIIMIVYAYVMQVSVGGLFAAGFVPGIIMGGLLMAMTVFLARRRNYPKREHRARPAEQWHAFRGAFLPLLTPVIILGGILSGVFTPTEAAAAAVVYALLLSLFVTRSLKLADLPRVLLRAGLSSAAILLVIGAAVAFGWIAAVSRIPDALGSALLAVSDNRYVLLFLINILLLVVGMFLDAGPAILILGPILAPTMINLGVDPLHFAIIMSVNLTVGLATPPIGLVLFVASSITREKVEVIAREMAPFLAVHLSVIMLITYIPEISMTLPRLLGLA
ncbi:MAG: TRAP transporter large permease [Immundisolibacterales bacterium]|nr:TRAP transporter large permease [Immundisolibacterales bacterium]